MKKIAELLKAYLIGQIRSPFRLLWTAGLVGGLFLFGVILNPGQSGAIMASYSVFLLSYSSAVMLGMVISQERESGLFRMIRTTRVSKLEYITSKFLISNFLGAIFASIILALGILNAGLSFRPLGFITVISLTALSHTGIGLIIAAFLKKDNHVQFAGSAVMMVMFILSPVFYSLESLPEAINFTPWLVPLTYAVEGMRLVAVESSSLTSIIPHAAVLIVFGSITFTIGYRKLEF